MTSTRYRYLAMPLDHPFVLLIGAPGLQGSKCVIAEHRLVLFEAIGVGPHRCHWCPRFVDWVPAEGVWKLEADHLDNDGRNNQRINLVPSCHRCNGLRESGPAVFSPDVGHGRGGEFNGRAKVTVLEVAEIRRLYTGKRGQQTELAARFGLKKAQVSRIIRGESW